MKAQVRFNNFLINFCIFVSAWQQSSCSVTCGTGMFSRFRTITSTGNFDVTTCPNLQETGICRLAACPPQPINCQVSDWFDSGSCIAANCLSQGYKLQSCSILQYPGNGGQPCNQTVRYVPCTPDCSSDCIVSNWSQQACSVTCGSGFTSRSRAIISPPMGSGRQCPVLFETGIPCSVSPCPSTDCIVGPWVNSTCSGNCVQTLVRSVIAAPTGNGAPCPALYQADVPCDVSVCSAASQPAACEFTEWQDDGICSIPCGGVGAVHQIRFIKYAPSGLNGNLLFACGPLERIAPCYQGQCGPQQCVLSEWTIYGSSCSVTCGVGIGLLTRSILIPPIGGAPCPALDTTSTCVQPSCMAYKPPSHVRLESLVLDAYSSVIRSCNVVWNPASGDGIMHYELYLSFIQSRRRQASSQVFLGNASINASAFTTSDIDYSVFDTLLVYVRFPDGLGANPGSVSLVQSSQSSGNTPTLPSNGSGSLVLLPVIMAVVALVLIVVVIAAIIFVRRHREKQQVIETEAVEASEIAPRFVVIWV
jgi:hypothetical protein